ncbi:hypothetical protein [Lederbergia lenta]|uniref:hypothetical protein n=1 Tax=Lederbergia lenta TaxID=1467 RepID=UPI00203CA06D|nr:hypothetical protein [Lederbergia lenta]MCM3110030.1 hypothetical protein [Lederbergia lenta]
MALDTNKLQGLFSRVVNNKLEENDGRDITEFAKRVFGDGSANPDPSMLHQFNNLVVKEADKVSKPLVTDMLGIFATYKNANRDQVVKYEIPTKSKAKVRWSANGSGVDLVRVEGKKFEIAVPQTFSTGFYYEPFGIVQDAVESTQKLVNDIANAKARLFLDQIYKLIDAAVTGGDIPAANILAGDNLTLAQYNKLASTLARYGGRPVFVGDTLLIDHFAMQQATDSTYKELLTDPVRSELLSSLNPTKIARTDAANLVNPFVNENNNKVELPVNVGYMFAGSQSQKPFVVTEFGGLRQMTEQAMEDERVKIKLTQDADVQLIFGETIGRITENTSVAL